ncbi:MAG TPA: hypothetical protein VN042_06735, partial [Asticcacaulis sp.]|nr:hypothetical protein [Asticcacaulis sp.]
MGREDWFRNATWSADIETAFFAKLNRARSQKSQYLVIQALTLAKTRPDICLKLIDLYFAQGEDVNNDFDHVRALDARRQAYEATGDIPRALDAIKAVLKQEQLKPRHIVGADVQFPYFVASHNLTAEYSLAKTLLDNRAEDSIIFPVIKFKIYAAYALMADDLKLYTDARSHAGEALRWAHMSSSGLRYHPTVGLVTDAYQPMI